MKDIAKKRELQTAWDVAAIMADFELQAVANRTKVFRNALQAPDFRAGVYEQLQAFDAANRAAAQQAFNDIRKLTEREFKLLYGEGVGAVDEAVKRARARGHDIPAQQKRSTSVLTDMLLVTLGRFASTLMMGRDQAQKQLLQITSQVSGAYDIPEQLSRAQSVYAGKGLTIKQGATEKDIVALSEFQLRNDGRNLQLKAEGERSAEYGMHYFQISGHPSSCPLCTPWQGKVVIDDVFAAGKPDGKTPLMSEAIAQGLYHFNCRHERTVYIPGVSKPNLYRKDIASLKETATRYAIEQQQRYNERGIREWKLREAAALTDKEQQLAQYKVKEWQAKQHDLRKIAKQEGVPFYRQYSREQIGGETTPKARAYMSK